MLDRRIQKIITTYKAEREEFTKKIYITNSGWYRRFYIFYSDWDSFSILEEENNFNARMASKIKNACISNESLSTTVSSLKNRVEYLSEHVDFFTSYITFIILLLAFLKTVITYFNLPNIVFLELPVMFIFLILITVFSIEKYLLRKEVMHKKEIINIFEKHLSENKK